MRQKSFWATAVILVLLHLALVMPALQHPERLVVADSQQYMDLANGMLQTGRFVSLSDPTMDFLRTPGYPAFLVLVKVLFGDFRWTSFLQMLIVVANSYVLYHVAIEIGAPVSVGSAAALFNLLNPNTAFVALRILTETLTAFCLLFALWMLVRFWNSRAYKWLVASGVMMGLATLVRPSCYPLFIIWVLIIWVSLAVLEKKKIWRGVVLRPAIILFASGFILVFLWQARNFVVHNAFSLSPVGRSTFRNWVIGEAMAETYGIPRADAEYMINTAPNATVFIVQYVRDNLVAFTRITLRGILYTTLAIEYRYWISNITALPYIPSGLIPAIRSDTVSFIGNLQSGNFGILLGWYALLFDALIYVLSGLAFWRIFIRRETDARLLVFFAILLVTFAYTIITPLGHGAARFRAPVEPFLALMAACAFYRRAEPKQLL